MLSTGALNMDIYSVYRQISESDAYTLGAAIHRTSDCTSHNSLMNQILLIIVSSDFVRLTMQLIDSLLDPRVDFNIWLPYTL